MASGSVGVGESIDRSIAGRLRSLRRLVANWWWVGPYCWVVAPSRFPPHRGLTHTRLGRRELTVRLRDGGSIRCRAGEVWPLVEVFIDGQYRLPGIHWATATTVVDIGANVGVASLWITRAAPASRLVSVEPSPSAYPLLRANMRDNGLTDRVTTVHAAVGAADGVAYMLPADISVDGRVSTNEVPGATPVPQVTLGTVLAEHGLSTVDVLKIDCEGAEYAIFEAASGDDMSRVGSIIGEYHEYDGHQRHQLTRLLESSGFTVWMRPHNDTVGFFTAVRRN